MVEYETNKKDLDSIRFLYYLKFIRQYLVFEENWDVYSHQDLIDWAFDVLDTDFPKDETYQMTMAFEKTKIDFFKHLLNYFFNECDKLIDSFRNWY